MKRIFSVLRYVPRMCRIIFSALVIAVVLHISFAHFPSFAELYGRTVGAALRGALAFVTDPLPVSVAEAALIMSPLALVWVIVLAVGTGGRTEPSVRLISSLAALIAAVYVLFVLTFASGFYTRSIGEYFGIEDRDITVNELYDATLATVDGANAAYGELEGRGLLQTSMGFDYTEMSRLLVEELDSLSETYGCPTRLGSRIKPVILSEPMTYTHISGVYTFFTGEANVNINFPDFVIPYTAAHELSHQRGISRENEANFVAFVACVGSKDPYVRYSGYLNMYQYMSSALYSADPELYRETYNALDKGVRSELVAYGDFFDKYRDNPAATVSGAVNDTYLTVMSGEDSRSYGMVVDTATLYLLGERNGVNGDADNIYY